MWAPPGVSLSGWMFVRCRECLVSTVASTLAWPRGVLQSAVRPEGGSKKALDNPIWAQGRQRKWLGIPDGGHNQENSCKGLNFNTSVWNSRLLPFSLSRSPPSPRLPPSAPSVSFFKFQTENIAFRTTVDCLANPAFFLVFIIPILWLKLSTELVYFVFHPFVLLSCFFPSVSLAKLSFALLSDRTKKAAYIWLWSYFTFLFLTS